MDTRLFCFAPYGGAYAVHHQLDFAISLGVKLRGGSVVTLGCNSLYERCEAVMYAPDTEVECRNCAVNGRRLLGHEALNFVIVNDLVTAAEAAAASEWSRSQLPSAWESAEFGGNPLGSWALSSLLSAYQISRCELDQQRLVPFYQALLRNTALTALAVQRIVEHFRPTVGLVFNGRFAQYRAAFEILRRAGIRVFTHERGFSDNSFLIYENASISDQEELFKVGRAWSSVSLTRPQMERVRDALDSRQRGKELNSPAMMKYLTDECEVRAKLFVGTETLIGFFTSTEAEMAHTGNQNIENVQLPLLRSAIAALTERPQYTLVVRHHPNLAGTPSHPPDYRFITELYRARIGAPSNLRVIMPTEPISTYSLLWNVDGVIAPFSAVGLEAASRGSASLTSAHGPFSLGQEMAFEDHRNVDFRSVFDHLVERSVEFGADTLRKAYRFFYTYIERISVRFKSIGIRNFYEMDLSPTIVEDLTNRSDENLTRIVDGVAGSGSVYALPPPSGLEGDDSEELEFLNAEVARINTTKREVRNRSKLPATLPRVLRLCAARRDAVFPAYFGERYPQIRQMTIDSTSDFHDDLRMLLEAARGSDADFVAYVHPSFSQDEDFVCTGVETLSGQSGGMLLRGTWLGDREGTLVGEFLTKRTGDPTWERVTSTFGDCPHTLKLLSLGFYRREYFADVVANFLKCPSEISCRRALVQSWSENSTLVERRQVGVMIV